MVFFDDVSDGNLFPSAQYVCSLRHVSHEVLEGQSMIETEQAHGVGPRRRNDRTAHENNESCRQRRCAGFIALLLLNGERRCHVEDGVSQVRLQEAEAYYCRMDPILPRSFRGFPAPASHPNTSATRFAGLLGRWLLLGSWYFWSAAQGPKP